MFFSALRSLSSQTSTSVKASLSAVNIFRRTLTTNVDATTASYIQKLRDQLRYYAVAEIAGRPYLITQNDKVIVNRLNDVKVGDVLKLNRTREIGSKDYALVGEPFVQEGLYDIQATVIEHTKSKLLATTSQQWLNHPRLALIKNIIFLLVIYHYGSHVYAKVLVGGPVRALADLNVWVKRFIFRQMKRIPSVRNKIESEIKKNIDDMETSMLSKEANLPKQYQLPAHGLSKEQVLVRLKELQDLKSADWKGGKVSGTIYHGGEELTGLLGDAYRMFAVANPLHPEVFPGIRRMEAESVAMVLHMYNAPSTGCGTMTSGGTESIVMACKTYRDMYRDLKGIRYPEMVVPVTIHAAFNKAAEYFNIKLIAIPVDPVTLKVDLNQMARAITSNTVMIAGSAVNFPHGIADDIVALGKLAKKHNIGLHVDCCLGSFVMPFLEKAGFPTTPFDFRVDGVTSISCDTHKYGFAAKGSSIIMYKTPTIRKYQYFLFAEWTGGIYASPSVAGSRPGALIAGCWSALMNLGEDGYLDTCKQIIHARQTIQAGVASTPELFVMGDPIGPVVSFGAKRLNIYDVGDKLSGRGWNISALQNPPALHISVTLPWVQSADQFVKDMKEVTADLVANPGQAKGSSAAIYGTAASVPDKSIVEDVAAGFIDLLYKA
ncbi:sphingosine-1-phosphate lyase [Hesseltinella vesiculosa]|uniref:sphinganine-1-phosphate aldolase n=1 Tax=Hesseltinella vesiculosa TaxID=101127 RepID=A0A1X2GAG6_9FUNG|nr:sphingosine-1-phosphate lyase [Hesseltinella vesiculosa]